MNEPRTCITRLEGLIAPLVAAGWRVTRAASSDYGSEDGHSASCEIAREAERVEFEYFLDEDQLVEWLDPPVPADPSDPECDDMITNDSVLSAAWATHPERRLADYRQRGLLP